MIETLTNGRPKIGLTEDQRRQIQERHLVEQEAQEEQMRLSYEAARAATARLRRELEGE